MTPEPCPDYVSLLVRAGDDSLDPEQRRTLDAHVATCAACREALADQQISHAALAAHLIAHAPAGFVMRVMSNLTRESWLDRFDFRRWTWRLAPLAAAIALAAYVVVGSAQSTVAAVTTSDTSTEIPVSAALMSDAVTGSDLMSLMLFASPDDSLTTALKETAQ